MNRLKRYILFLIGLFINSLGVSLVTKANLGTSPISSIPYVLSLNFPLTLDNYIQSSAYHIADYYFEEEFQAGKYPADSGFYCIRLFH